MNARTALAVECLRRALWLAATLLPGLLLGGCQVGRGAIERFDERSGLTLITDPLPVVYARTEPRLSRSARDYVYLGPVEVNERGTREYFLWVGLASTIDRDYLDADVGSPTILYLDLQGEPMELPLAAWAQRQPRVGSSPLYRPVVAPFAEFAARVTLDQLARLQLSAPDRIRIGSGDSPQVEYVSWKRGDFWPDFMEYAAIARER